MTANADSPNMTPNDTRADVQAPDMKRHVIRGILLVGVAAVFMRGGGLLAQLVTGKVLLPEDFGLFAVTLGLATISVASLSALRPLFIERLTNGQEVDRLWRWMLLGMVILAVLLALGSGAIADALNKPEARNVLLAMAPSLPIQFAQVLGVARLAAQLRFAESSKILTIAAMSRHGSMIAFALLGFGVYSLVLPVYVEAAVQAVLLWRATGAPPSVRGPVRGVLAEHRATLGWLLLTAVALAISLNGDYFAIGFFEESVIVGLYFFGYQLSAALTQPFTMAATNVLVPSFASVKDQEALRSSYLDAISVLLLVTGIAFGGLALIGGQFIDQIWNGKWNESIVAMALISAGTPFRILQPTCYSLLQSLGRWSTHARLATLNAMFAIGGAILGASIGGLREIALCVAISGTIVGITVAVLSGRYIGIPAGRTLLRLVRASFPPIAGLVVAFGLFPELLVSVPATIGRAAIFAAITLPLAFVLFRSSIQDIVRSIRK